MKKIIDVGFYYGTNYIRKKKIVRVGKEKFYENLKSYAGKKVLSNFEVNAVIAQRIKEGNPFCAGRFGATELFCSSMFEFDVSGKKNKAMNQLVNWSGFFPNDSYMGDQFNAVIKDSVKELDVLGIWNLRYEDYYVKKNARNNVKLTYLYNLEPWTCPEQPWSSALSDKKVLVIHPFEESIKSQYKKRDAIFHGTGILPEFKLKTLKAVQTIAGVRDDRFLSWFDALKWMYERAMEIDFDIAIIGCGAYGLPLAAKIKSAGKQAIHLGGATQLLFGIKGKRWDEEEDKAYARAFYNDSWVYPLTSEKPENADVVENGCYW